MALVEEGKDPVATFDIQNRFEAGPIVLNNVVATPATVQPHVAIVPRTPERKLELPPPETISDALGKDRPMACSSD